MPPFDRILYEPWLSRPRGYRKALCSDLMAGQATLDTTALDTLRALCGLPAAGGFLGDGFALQPYPDNRVSTLILRAGIGLLPGASRIALGGYSGLDNRAAFVPVVLDHDIEIPVPPPDAEDRVDVLAVAPSFRIESQASGRVVYDRAARDFAGVSPKDATFSLGDRLGYDKAALLQYRRGVAGQSSPPSVPGGWAAIANVRVLGGASTLLRGHVNDLRRTLFPGAVGAVTGRVSLGVVGPDPSVATLSAVQAPPGVLVAAHGGTATGLASLYVFPGQAASAVTVQARLDGLTGRGRVGIHVSHSDADSGGSVLTAAETSRLASASLCTAPALYYADASRIRVDVVLCSDAGAAVNGDAWITVRFMY